MHTIPSYVRSTLRRADYPSGTDGLVEALTDAIREVANTARVSSLELDWTRASVESRDFGSSPERGFSVPLPSTAVVEVEVPVLTPQDSR